MLIGRRIASWTILALLLGGTAIGQTAEEAFERGNAAYEAGDWSASASAYRTVLDYGIRDPRVHYNLGNAEFRLRRLGPAILHYEKAARLAPSDDQIRSNLEFAQGFRFDLVEVDPPFVLAEWLHRVQARLGVDGQSWLLLVCFSAIGAVLVLGLSRAGRFGAGRGWTLAVLLVGTSMVGLSWWNTYERLELRVRAVVMAPAAEIVAGPGLSNPTLVTVHEGLTVTVLESRPEWVQVSLPNGINGWISARAIARV